MVRGADDLLHKVIAIADRAFFGATALADSGVVQGAPWAREELFPPRFASMLSQIFAATSVRRAGNGAMPVGQVTLIS